MTKSPALLLHNARTRAKTLPLNVAKIIDKTVWPEPPRYPIEATGYTVKASHYSQLLARIREHCEANEIATPSESEVEQWLCENLSLRCVENGKPFENQYLDRRHWPILLRPMKLLARESDVGLGDIVYHAIGDDRSEAFKAWFKSAFNRDCNCGERRTWLNKTFPL